MSQFWDHSLKENVLPEQFQPPLLSSLTRSFTMKQQGHTVITLSRHLGFISTSVVITEMPFSIL